MIQKVFFKKNIEILGLYYKHVYICSDFINIIYYLKIYKKDGINF